MSFEEDVVVECRSCGIVNRIDVLDDAEVSDIETNVSVRVHANQGHEFIDLCLVIASYIEECTRVGGVGEKLGLNDSDKYLPSERLVVVRTISPRVVCRVVQKVVDMWGLH